MDSLPAALAKDHPLPYKDTSRAKVNGCEFIRRLSPPKGSGFPPTSIERIQIMKKKEIAILALSMLMLAGCGSRNSAANTAAPALKAETVTAEKPQSGEVPVPNLTSAPAENPVPAAEPETEQPAPVGQAAPGQDPESARQTFTGVMGTEFAVPEGFVQLDESAAVGYQYTFWHPDYEIRIEVHELTPGAIPEGAYETDLENARNNPDAVYFNNGEDWFVQSGYNSGGEEIFYCKESSAGSGLKYFQITYPTAKREFGDTVTAEFEAGFRF